MVVDRFTINLGSNVRHDTLEGRDYLVGPVVMLTEGVHDGSKGKLYYGPDEMGKTPVVWNHKPIVVYHPEVNGEGVSACDPVVMESRKVGIILQSKWDGKLRAEAWIEKDKANKVDPRIVTALENGQMMEVSTGLFTDNEYKPGEWNGEKYDYIARNFRPDHLAILPDKVGACSIKDGAGLLQTNESPFLGEYGIIVNRDFSSKERDSMDKSDFGDPDRKAYPIKSQKDLENAASLLHHAKNPSAVKDRLKAIAKRKGLSLPKSWDEDDKDDKTKNTADCGGSPKMQALTKEQCMNLQAEFIASCSTDKRDAIITNKDGKLDIVCNVISHQDVAKGLTAAMLEEQGKAMGYFPGFIESVYDDFYIYSQDGKYYKRGYAIDGNYNANPFSDKEEVSKHSEWRGKDGKHIAVKDRDMKGSRVSGGSSPNSSSSDIPRPGEPAQPQKAELSATPGNRHELPGNKGPIGGGGQSAAGSKPYMGSGLPIGNAGVNHNMTMTTDEYINNAPPEIRDMLRQSVDAHSREKVRLVEIITANKRNKFTKEHLLLRDLPELQAIAELAVEPTQNVGYPPMFHGAAGAPPLSTLATNGSKQEPLGRPQMKFDPVAPLVNHGKK